MEYALNFCLFLLESDLLLHNMCTPIGVVFLSFKSKSGIANRNNESIICFLDYRHVRPRTSRIMLKIKHED